MSGDLVGEEGKGAGAMPVRGAGATPAPGLVFFSNKGEMEDSSPSSSGSPLKFGDVISIPMDNQARRLRQMRSGVIEAARSIEAELQSANIHYRAALVTLTYRDGAVWSPRDVNDLLAHYRKWATRRGVWIHYVWTLELTKTGRPHYHILIFLPRGVTPPLPDKQGWWRKGSTNAKWARYAVRYIAKYASKGFGGDFSLPPNAHIWGCSRLTSQALGRLRWCQAPTWLKKLVPYEEGVRRVGRWWVNLTTGWAYLSPWLFDSHTSGSINLRWIGWTLESVFIPHSPDEPLPAVPDYYL